MRVRSIHIKALRQMYGEDAVNDFVRGIENRLG